MKEDRRSKLQKKAERGILFIEIVTKGELIEKYKSPKYARAAIARDARRVFEREGKPKRCFICGYNKHVEICHIRGVSSFGNEDFIGVINDPNNLMALCPNHHWEFDNNILEFDDDVDFNDFI